MRGKKTPKRKINPDPKYNSITIAKFINHLMRGGKKTVAQKIVYGALDILSKNMHQGALEVFNQAMENVKPQVEVRSRRIGGANYQIPMQVSSDRGITLAFRWIIQAARAKKGQPMQKKLASELLDAYHNQGVAIKKKQDVYRMAQANRAFAHFAR